MPAKIEKWTNKSVRMLAGASDPVEVITRLARDAVLEAMDKGWSGPPFDLMALCDLFKVRVTPRADIRDARTIPMGEGLCIEYNPTRPRGRVRYSIAHEIAHTLFPDCAQQIRSRTPRHEMKGDDWQLEMLCNIAASEFLMPIGSLGAMKREDLGIDHMLELRKKYDVSTEAILLRAVRATDSPCAAFSAFVAEEGPNSGRYFVEYVIPSRDWISQISKRVILHAPPVIAQCSTIGFTAKGTEHIGPEKYHAECVGIPSYPGSRFPRVAGILTSEANTKPASGITELKGDATSPFGTGKKIIAHIVNDATPNWGGNGFAQAIKSKWREAQDAFRNWADAKTRQLVLGNLHLADVSSEITIASMVCQKGYGASASARLRYSALESCLQKLARVAVERGASIHIPRIGCGQGGGSWFLVKELISATLLSEGVRVFVYEPPGSDTKPGIQASLPL